MSDRIWHVARATSHPDAREAIEYALMQAGALGTETSEAAGLTIVRGYFDTEPESQSLKLQLYDGLRIYNQQPATLLDLQIEQLADRDWLAEWKKGWQPVEIGRFIIAPPWLMPAGAARSSVDSTGPDRILIQIDPGMAFGTGTHETTRLCLKAIDKHFRGQSFLDVGTGTGVLAIAAAKMVPAARVEAYDTDAEAIAIAQENARLNKADDRIEFRTGSIDDQTASADFVCANLTAQVILELLPALLEVTCGRLVLSGILDTQIELIQNRLTELGSHPIEIDQDGEWVAIVI